MSGKRHRTDADDRRHKPWSPEEFAFLEARVLAPPVTTIREFRAAGFARPRREVNRMLRALEDETGLGPVALMRAQGREPMPDLEELLPSPGPQVALRLAATHELPLLQAALQVREVLDRLE